MEPAAVEPATSADVDVEDTAGLGLCVRRADVDVEDTAGLGLCVRRADVDVEDTAVLGLCVRLADVDSEDMPVPGLCVRPPRVACESNIIGAIFDAAAFEEMQKRVADGDLRRALDEGERDAATGRTVTHAQVASKYLDGAGGSK